ncbi:MAG: bifunctional phosphoribosylaminoimidazolecarboxamide formyltransferase/IMP cyclohydrolase, partial [Bdellovibrionales bacterium]|nr:bifunctional phosphoribosylaminoimidazolecarboxamide formyltransferase/IMP cyclohydrolase [Bdellovibrionales bacterium]
EAFDMVVVNLYPFAEGLTAGESEEEMIELIDIGGPTLLRAASKNFESILVVSDPSDYSEIMSRNEYSRDFRKSLAAKVFRSVSDYDQMIANYLAKDTQSMRISGEIKQTLRYGENPQQSANWFKCSGEKGLHDAEILQGKELSYNNLMDLDAAVRSLQLFDGHASVAVKHSNPCGVGEGISVLDAVTKCLAADPVSVFGGIVAISGTIDLQTAEKLNSIFLECVIAPDITDEALDLFKKKKNLRLLKWPDMMKSDFSRSVQRSILGGFLSQSADTVESWGKEWEVIGETPSNEVKSDIVFTWKVAARLKSNAIAIGRSGMSLGLGMGQVNRVDAVKHAIERWKHLHPEVSSPILCSDAFFPFPDSIEIAHKAGVRWIVQPGGSIKDPEVIQRCKDLGVNLVLTKTRHFLH